MELIRVSVVLAMVFALVAVLFLPGIAAQSPAAAPAPASDVVAIDQGIAYVLMLAALVLTYLIH